MPILQDTTNGGPPRVSGLSVGRILQLRFRSTHAAHPDIVREQPSLMRPAMAGPDADPAQVTQSLGCWSGWSGFQAQQMVKAVMRLRGTTMRAYIQLPGWIVAAFLFVLIARKTKGPSRHSLHCAAEVQPLKWSIM